MTANSGLRLPEVARLQVCRGCLHPEIAVLDHARPEIAHQCQHRADRAAGSDEMNAIDKITSLFDSQRLHGRHIVLPIAVANHGGGEWLPGKNSPSEVGLQE